MKLKLTILILLLAVSLKAQQYQLFTAATDKSMRVKWMSKNIDATASYDLFRKDNGGNWQKINGQPIAASPIIAKSELETGKNPFPKDSAYVMYIEYKTNIEATPNKQAYADYTLSMAAVYDNAMARHMGIFYEDTSVEKGKKYQYRLVQSASQKELAVSSEMGLGDTYPAPTEFKSKQEKQDVRFDWKAGELFISYNLYRNGSRINTDPILANLEGKTYLVTYRDENLKPGTYKFTVKGMTFLNTESQPTAEITVEVKDQTPPSAIKGFKIERKGTEVAMQWSASTDKDIKGYHIYKSDDKGKTFKKLTDQPIDARTSQYKEKLTAGNFGSFQYYVEAMDQAGNTTPSVKAAVFVPDNQAPEIPKSFVFKSESGKISLSWTANNEKDLAGYRIYRGLADDDQNSMLLLNVTPQMATTYIDTFPKKAKTKFIYKVSALDKAFNESPKASAWIQLPDIEPPAAPVLMEPTLSGNEISLQWSAVLTDAVAGYDVYRVIDGNKTKINTAKITGVNFTDKGPAQKGLYQYYVTAIDSANLESRPSNKVYINTAAGKINDVKLLLAQDARTKKVQIEIAGVEPAFVQSVKLYRKDGDTGFQVVPYAYKPEPTVDETTEPGKIYEYYAEIIDIGDQKMKSEIVNFNNP
jgi:fibronectin type 3 domain-containing protein